MTKTAHNVMRVAGGKFAKGQSGNPAGKQPKTTSLQALPKEFAEAHGQLVLDLLLQHAANNATAALGLVDRIFGSSNWGGDGISSLLGSMKTINECDEALSRVLTAYSNGSIILKQCERLEALIASKKAGLADGEDTVTGPEI